MVGPAGYSDRWGKEWSCRLVVDGWLLGQCEADLGRSHLMCLPVGILECEVAAPEGPDTPVLFVQQV
ncbi:MAG: hypothetical protein ACI9N0_001432, partial [Ilumatobacter sp.]